MIYLFYPLFPILLDQLINWGGEGVMDNEGWGE